MRLILLVSLLAGCARNDRQNTFDLKITRADGSKESLSLKDRTGYFHRDSSLATMSWPSFDEYGIAEEFAYIDYAAMVPGPQQLTTGVITLANGTTYDLGGNQVVAQMEVKWNGGKQFPVLQSGSFEAEINGDLLEAEFTMAPSNCMNNITRSGGCGGPYLLEEPMDLTWVKNFAGCPEELVDAVLGSDLDGTLSEEEMTLGDTSLACEMNYNLEIMCGDDPFEVEVDGCTWTVFNYAYPENVAINGNYANFYMNAGNTCEGPDVPTACNTAFTSPR